MKSEFSIDYFIKKFKAIPEDQWTEKVFGDGTGSHCALGHCGSYIRNNIETVHTPESKALMEILGDSVVYINDGLISYDLINYTKLGNNPKTRILNALKRTKKGKQI